MSIPPIESAKLWCQYYSSLWKVHRLRRIQRLPTSVPRIYRRDIVAELRKARVAREVLFNETLWCM